MFEINVKSFEIGKFQPHFPKVCLTFRLKRFCLVIGGLNKDIISKQIVFLVSLYPTTFKFKECFSKHQSLPVKRNAGTTTNRVF